MPSKPVEAPTPKKTSVVAPKTPATFGLREQVQFKDLGLVHTGHIAAVNPDGTYTVAYQMNVPRSAQYPDGKRAMRVTKTAAELNAGIKERAPTTMERFADKVGALMNSPSWALMTPDQQKKAVAKIYGQKAVELVKQQYKPTRWSKAGIYTGSGEENKSQESNSSERGVYTAPTPAQDGTPVASAKTIALKTMNSISEGIEKVKQARSATQKILNEFDNKPIKIDNVISILSNRLHAKPVSGRSRYRTYALDFATEDGQTFTLRLSDHSAHASAFVNNGSNGDFNVSIVVNNKGQDTALRNKNDDVVLTQYTYSKEDFDKTDDVRKLIESVKTLFDTGRYIDLTGKAIVDRSGIRMWSKATVTPEEDAAYLDAVESGDRDTALRMIREAAAKAMPNFANDKDGLPKVINTLNSFDLPPEYSAWNSALPPEAAKEVSSWETISKSPYSDSFYNANGITWDYKPDGSLRIADHWNFFSRGEKHCQTTDPIENGIWAMGRYDAKTGKYTIVKTWERGSIDYFNKQINQRKQEIALQDKRGDELRKEIVRKSNEESIDGLNKRIGKKIHSPIRNGILREVGEDEYGDVQIKVEVLPSHKIETFSGWQIADLISTLERTGEIKREDKYNYFDANKTGNGVFLDLATGQTKSADITYDDAGNVIPLSERFNPEKDDIRWSKDLTPDEETRSLGYQEHVRDNSITERQRGILRNVVDRMLNGDDVNVSYVLNDNGIDMNGQAITIVDGRRIKNHAQNVNGKGKKMPKYGGDTIGNAFVIWYNDGEKLEDGFKVISVINGNNASEDSIRNARTLVKSYNGSVQELVNSMYDAGEFFGQRDFLHDFVNIISQKDTGTWRGYDVPQVLQGVLAEKIGNTTIRHEVPVGKRGLIFPETGRGTFWSKASKEESARLDGEPTIKVYRAMQVIDGKLYPPMATKVEGKLVSDAKLGEWLVADEPTEYRFQEMIRNKQIIPKKKKNGDVSYLFKLDKANGSSIEASYNPYWHTSRSPLNDQFSSAYNRPNLVTVEVEVPISELSSGYKADHAKDAVCEMAWHSGPVSSKLAKMGMERKVILSRYCKPIRVIPDAEVANNIAAMIKGKDIAIPENVVTPSLKDELVKRGVSITPISEVRWSKAHPSGTQKAANVAYPDASEDVRVLWSKAEGLGTRKRDEMKALIQKKRPDLGNAMFGIDAMFGITFSMSDFEKAHPELFDQNGWRIADTPEWEAAQNDFAATRAVDEIAKFKTTKEQKAALDWFIKGSIRLPEDAPKVTQAIEYGERAKGKGDTDPLHYNSPMAMIDALHEFKPKAQAINPDTVPELSDRQDMGHGVVTYLVQDDRAGQEAMRRIINTHFGEDANPWCLLHGDGHGNLSDGSDGGYDAAHYWKHYSSLPKRVAFKDGKLLAFMATDARSEEGSVNYASWLEDHRTEFEDDNANPPDQWWDRKDASHDGIPLGNMPVPNDKFGRWADFEIKDGELRQIGGYAKRINDEKVVEWNEDGSLLRYTNKDWRYDYDNGKIKLYHRWYLGTKHFRYNPETATYSDGTNFNVPESKANHQEIKDLISEAKKLVPDAERVYNENRPVSWSKEVPEDVQAEISGISFDRMNHYRRKVGLDPLPRAGRSLDDMEREARGLFANRDLVMATVDAVNKKPRALSEEETIAIGLAQTEAQNQYEVKMAESAEALERAYIVSEIICNPEIICNLFNIHYTVLCALYPKYDIIRAILLNPLL